MSRPRAFPVATRVPAPVYAELEAAAAARLTTISTITRDFLTAAHLSGAFAAHLAAQLTAPNPVGLSPSVAPSAAPAAPAHRTPVQIEPGAQGERRDLVTRLEDLFDSPEEIAARAAAHTASTPAPAVPAKPSIQDLVDAANPRDWLWLDGSVPTEDEMYQLVRDHGTPEAFEKHKAKLRKQQEQERIRATILTPEQTLARIAEGMAAVRSQPGHGYIEPWVPVTHAPHREPLTAANSAELPEAGTPEWVAMAQRQGLPPEAIAEVVAATQPAGAPEAKVVSSSFNFDEME